MGKMAIIIRSVILLCLMGLSSGQGQTPKRPEPSESSTYRVRRIQPDSWNSEFYPMPSAYMIQSNLLRDSYDLYQDYNSGNTLYVYQLGANAYYGTRHVLLRDDLSAMFEYYEPFGYPYCHKQTGSMEQSPPLQFPARWTWLNETKYVGREKLHGKDVDLWSYIYNGTDPRTPGVVISTFHELGVSKRDPDVPVFKFNKYMFNGPGSFGLSVYEKFINGIPPERTFDYPERCHVNGLEGLSTEQSDKNPLRPKLAESFSAKITYVRVLEVYLGEETLQAAELYRNYEDKMQLQVNPLGSTPHGGSYHRLLRQDKNIQYNFFEPFGSCSLSDPNPVDESGLEKPMWEWIRNAKYSGVKEFRRKKVNMWTYIDNATSIFHSLGVSRKNPNKPVVLFEMPTSYTYRRNVTVFESYKAGSPPKRIFTVPKVCNGK